MMERNVRCDRTTCGKTEKAPDSLVRTLPTGWSVMRLWMHLGADTPVEKDVHFCPACTNAFVRWLNAERAL